MYISRGGARKKCYATKKVLLWQCKTPREQQNNFVLELPPNFLRFKSTTFSIVVRNPLRFEYWYLWTLPIEFEASTDNTKHPSSLATILGSRLLQYVSKGLESYVYGRSKRAWQVQQVKKISSLTVQADKQKQRNFFVSILSLLINNCFQHKPCICPDLSEKPCYLKFWSSIVCLPPLPQLVANFYKSPQRSTNSVWRTLLNKTVRFGRAFCWTRMIEQRLFSRVSIRIQGRYLSRACASPTAAVFKSC